MSYSPNGKLSDLQIDEMLRMRSEGLPLHVIAEKLGVVKQTISNHLRRIKQEQLEEERAAAARGEGEVISPTKSLADQLAELPPIKKGMSMRAYIESRRNHIQRVLDGLLCLPPEMIRCACLRDRMGAVKILAECFRVPELEGFGDNKVEINLTVQDLTVKDEQDED